MDEKTPYMIRDIYPQSDKPESMVVCFEEDVIGYNENGMELCFPADYVRELLPAEDIMELIEELNYEMA